MNLLRSLKLNSYLILMASVIKLWGPQVPIFPVNWVSHWENGDRLLTTFPWVFCSYPNLSLSITKLSYKSGKKSVAISFITNPEWRTTLWTRTVKIHCYLCIGWYTDGCSKSDYVHKYITLKNPRARYFCARDGDHFCVGDHISLVGCSHVASTFIGTSLSLKWSSPIQRGMFRSILWACGLPYRWSPYSWEYGHPYRGSPFFMRGSSYSQEKRDLGYPFSC